MRLLLLSLLVLPLSVSAHGDAPSLEAEVGEYLIDIGYTPALAPRVPIEFDVDLFRKGPPIDYADFASADIRVSKDGTELETASVENDEVHVPTFAFTFPDPGGYDIDLRYLDDGGTLLAARTFHVEVPTESGVILREGFVAFHYLLAAGLFALSIGIGGYSLWQRFGKK